MHDTVPLYIERKTDWLIEDVDGNTFVDHVSAWGSNPLGAQPAETVERTIEAMRKWGFEITDYVRSEPPIRLAERLVELAPPGITRVATGITGTRGGRGGGEARPRGDRAPDDPRLPGPVPRRGHFLAHRRARQTDLSEVTTG